MILLLGVLVINATLAEDEEGNEEEDNEEEEEGEGRKERGEHSSQLKNKLVVTMKGRSGYTFFQIAVYAFTPMVTLERIVLWNYHPYHEAEGLVRERVGHWTILRAVATPVPESKSNPIQSTPC